MEGIKDIIIETVDEARNLTFEISPPILYEFGLEAALEWYIQKFQEQHALTVELINDGEEKPLGEDARVVLFRAVRELMFNIVKHAQASHVKLSLQRTQDYIRIDVDDDGIGFGDSIDLSFAKKNAGLGLFWINERIQYLGGMLTRQSLSPKGARVTLIFPLADCRNPSLRKIQEMRDSLPDWDAMQWAQPSKTVNEIGSPEINKALLRRLFDGVWNKRELHVVDEIFSPDFVFHSPMGELRGLETYKKTVQSLLSAFPDIQLDFDDMLAEGSKMAVRALFRGTHQGTFMGLPPTGRKVSFIGICIYSVSNGKIVEEWSSPDNFGLIQQISG